MKIYRLHTRQLLPISVETAWDFLSNPENLSVITPPEMQFEVIGGADRSIYPGQLIEYRVTPLLGIRTKWVTEITHVREGTYFVDEQRFGPYSLWHHKHFINKVVGGTEMEDIVHYKLPLGVAGRLLHPYLVKPRLDKIFQFRRQKLIELFGEMPNS